MLLLVWQLVARGKAGGEADATQQANAAKAEINFNIIAKGAESFNKAKVFVNLNRAFKNATSIEDAAAKAEAETFIHFMYQGYQGEKVKPVESSGAGSAARDFVVKLIDKVGKWARAVFHTCQLAGTSRGRLLRGTGCALRRPRAPNPTLLPPHHPLHSAPPTTPPTSFYQIDLDQDNVITKEEWIAHFAPASEKAQGKRKSWVVWILMMATNVIIQRIINSAVLHHLELAALAEGAPYHKFLPDFVIQNPESFTALVVALVMLAVDSTL